MSFSVWKIKPPFELTEDSAEKIYQVGNVWVVTDQGQPTQQQVDAALGLPNEPILNQIVALESAHPFTHRYFREQLLAAVGAGVIPSNHPVAVMAAAEEQAVQALRSQLT